MVNRGVSRLALAAFGARYPRIAHAGQERFPGAGRYLAYPGGSDGSTGRNYEGNSLRLESAVAGELQCSAVLRYGANDVVGSAFRDLRFDFQCDLYL